MTVYETLCLMLASAALVISLITLVVLLIKK
ncbi:MAG: putative holin-like toxin [Sporomusaceae bacterium]|nr:putative holin-like toxin [Sporomusaceae bacterium]